MLKRVNSRHCVNIIISNKINCLGIYMALISVHEFDLKKRFFTNRQTDGRTKTIVKQQTK